MAFRFGDFAANSQSLTTKGQRHILVGGLEHEFYDFPLSWEFPSIPTDFHSIIFQRGGSTTNLYRNHQYLMKFEH